MIHILSDTARLYVGDVLAGLASLPRRSCGAMVTDPPYSPLEFRQADVDKMRAGSGGVWRQPPRLGGVERRPVPRFTVLSDADREALRKFTSAWATAALAALVPGAAVVVASHPLTADVVVRAFREAGYEHRGAIVRLVRTLRGGDRPKGAETEFPELSAMPRSLYEPWCVFRTPMEPRNRAAASWTVADNLREWGTGALRRPSRDVPFEDVIRSAPARGDERAASSHPALKPQAFLRQIVRAVVPLPEQAGTVFHPLYSGGHGVLDPFAGSGSTLAACEALRIPCFGIERDPDYAAEALTAFPVLAAIGATAPTG